MRKKAEVMQKTLKFREKYSPFERFFHVTGWLMTCWILMNVRGKTEFWILNFLEQKFSIVFAFFASFMLATICEIPQKSSQ